jgi:Protein of unknown function (DUF2752)
MTSRVPHTALVCLVLAGAALLFAFDPAITWWFPSCPLNALTGWLCPFCGSLRALHALLHGAPRSAWALNPLTTAGAAAGLVALVHDAVRPARAMHVERLLSLCFSARGFALAVAFGVLRNIPNPLGWVVH